MPDATIAAQQQLYRLRIDARTVLLVPESKNNEEYARKVRQRMAKTGGPVSYRFLE